MEDRRRAMWVWDTSRPGATVDFAVAQGITQLYAAVPPHVASSPQLGQLHELSEGAATVGVPVDALGGDPGMDRQPGLGGGRQLARTGAGHRAVQRRARRPRAVHHAGVAHTGRATVVEKWLATLDRLRTGAGSAPLEADIPFWLDQVPAHGSTLDSEVMRRTDGVNVMAYRNTAHGPDGTIALASPAVRAGTALGCPVRVGAETRYLGSEPAQRKQTFFGRTRTQLEAQLGLVSTAYGSSPAFAGFAIHDAAGYAAMAP